MSQKNSGDGNRSARERLQQQREHEKAREKQRRILIVSAAVVGVLGLAAVVGVIAAGGDPDSGSDKAGPVVAPTGATEEDGKPAIPTGTSDAPSTLAIWEDFRCPACAQFENAFRDTIHELEAAGAIRTEYHLATLIDGNMGGSGSLRAANAAACAQDAGKFTAFHDTLYINQPPETDDAFGSNDKLIELAAKVPGLDTPAFRSCVNDGTHDTWVAKSNEAFRNGGFRGTPSVLLNGESIFPQKGSEQISPDNLKKWVAEANKGKKPGTAAPTTAPAASPGSPSAG
ncbi:MULTISPECIES: thioredoxin domain-containing protein [unclassified Streptomyces]|uniref:DsbA family protein n=1 Tax=unclassified Streptomyces TaxID=2593676 RepID=UPI001654D7A8|nr:thioredoxin domain-containing protein [Streptomyces sp. CB02980]MCB8904664.1 DsbA family protein [Streptomyces sp. CB02980]